MDEEFQKRQIEKIKKLRLMDDFFMTRFFEDNIEATQLVLRIILNKPDLQVERVNTQKSIKSLIGRGACLDVLAIDAEGQYYNIEVQKAKDGADFRRARLNGSLLDNYASKEGDKYKDIANTYVIFITEHDIIGLGRPVYHVGKFIEENMQKIDDGAYEIYVNGSYRADDDLGKLMADFCNPDYATMNYAVLRERSRYLKEEEGGTKHMCAYSEELLEEGRAEGEARGRIANAIESVKGLMSNLKLTAKAAMDAMNVAPADRPAILAAL